MVTTVAQLCELPQFGLRVLAGSSGLQRPVRWAHTCEQPDPWRVLGPDDLLLATGYRFPVDPAGQLDQIEHMASNGLSGLLLVEGMFPGPLHEPVVAQAERLRFPVLLAPYSVPLAIISKAVADARTQDSSARLSRILRIYESARQRSLRCLDYPAFLGQLGDEIDASLSVIQASAGAMVLGAAEATERLDKVGLLGSPLEIDLSRPFGRVTGDSATALLVPMSRTSGCVLAAVLLDEHRTPSLELLQHIASVVSIEVDRRMSLESLQRTSGASLFWQLIRGADGGPDLPHRLEAWGLGDPPWVVTAIGGLAEPEVDALRGTLDAAPVPNLILVTSRATLVLTSEMSEPSARLEDAGQVGVSRTVDAIDQVGDAVAEARLALETARLASLPIVRYGDPIPTFLPRTLAEGHALVDERLGDLIRYDAEYNGHLLTTLRVYFELNRSVQQSARRLSVHKQSIVYRLKRVQELTGRNFANLEDVTELFVAVQAWQLMNPEGMSLGVEQGGDDTAIDTGLAHKQGARSVPPAT